MGKNHRVYALLLTFFMLSKVNVYAAAMKRGSIGIGWAGYPVVRYWLGPKLGIELGADVDLRTSTQKNVVATNSFSISGKFLKCFFDRGDLNINLGIGANIGAVANAGAVGAGQTDFMLYGLIDFEYFLKILPNVSFGSSIGFGVTSSFYKPSSGEMTFTTRANFFANGFTLNAISIRYYFY